MHFITNKSQILIFFKDLTIMIDEKRTKYLHYRCTSIKFKIDFQNQTIEIKNYTMSLHRQLITACQYLKYKIGKDN